MRNTATRQLSAAAIAIAACFTVAAAQQPAGNAGSQASSAAKPAAGARGDTGAKLTPADTKFFNEAASGGMMEVQAAEVALSKGQSEHIKALAQKIRDDHTQANTELKTIADRKSLTLPPMDPKHKAALDALNNVSGDAFDKTYAAQMVRDHRKDVSAFRKASKDAFDSDLRGFAAKTLPHLEHHLQMARDAQKNLSGKK